MHKNSERVQAALRAAGSTAAVVELTSSARTATEAAGSLGVALGQIVKSLVFSADGEPVLVLVAGDRRGDLAAIAAALGAERVERAPAEVVRDATSFPIGGVPPLGHLRPLTTLLDESLGRFGVLWAAAGTPHAVFPTTLEELVDLTGGTACAVGVG